MSLKKSFLLCASMAMLASMNPGELPPSMAKQSRPTPKANRKKCKSCANYSPASYKGHCPYRGTVDPLEQACIENYKKKK